MPASRGELSRGSQRDAYLCSHVGQKISIMRIRPLPGLGCDFLVQETVELLDHPSLGGFDAVPVIIRERNVNIVSSGRNLRIRHVDSFGSQVRLKSRDKGNFYHLAHIDLKRVQVDLIATARNKANFDRKRRMDTVLRRFIDNDLGRARRRFRPG